MATIAKPFIGTEAVAAGRFTRRTLTSRNTMLFRNVYVPKGTKTTPVTLAVGAWLASGRTATVAGRSAAALHGSDWIEKKEPAELTRVREGLRGIVIHRERLLDDEVCKVRGIATTTPARTAFDLGRRPPLRTALANVDALARATGLTAPEVSAVLRQHKGARGIVQLRDIVDLMDGGAESPQESHTRLVLVEAGMQHPVTQIRVTDRWGVVFARLDMGWPEFKVGVEYDGPQHWTNPKRRSKDIDRYAELAALGWIIIRVNSDMLYRRPEVIVERTAAALSERGCPWLTSVGFRHAVGA
jgi:very-short-patch-repair endonuclease